jgi:hypothetical protein
MANAGSRATVERQDDGRAGASLGQPICHAPRGEQARLVARNALQYIELP